MAYERTWGGLSKEQRHALLDVTTEQIRDLPPEVKIELALRHRESFWTAVQGFATTFLPVLAFFGFAASLRRSRD